MSVFIGDTQALAAFLGDNKVNASFIGDNQASGGGVSGEVIVDGVIQVGYTFNKSDPAVTAETVGTLFEVSYDVAPNGGGWFNIDLTDYNTLTFIAKHSVGSATQRGSVGFGEPDVMGGTAMSVESTTLATYALDISAVTGLKSVYIATVSNTSVLTTTSIESCILT